MLAITSLLPNKITLAIFSSDNLTPAFKILTSSPSGKTIVLFNLNEIGC